MYIPQNKLDKWVQNIIDDCEISRSQRSTNGRFWQGYYENGADIDLSPAIYNRCFSHIDRTASYLYSPADVRFLIELDITMGREYLDRAQVSGRFLSREFHRAGSDLIFGAGVEMSLIRGCALMKQNYGQNGIEPYLVNPEAFGVYREDIPDLDKQEAFVHTTYLTPGQLRVMLWDHPERDKIYERIKREASSARKKSEIDNDYISQVIVGSLYPISTSGASGAARGSVTLGLNSAASLSPEVRAKLVRLDEVWVMDDERDDYTTIQIVDPGIVIEGKLRRRNLCGVQHEHPFTKICPNDSHNYFWGRSELAPVRALQDLLNKRVEDYDRLSDIRADPPKSYTGFNGITDEMNALMSAPGGFVTESNPGAKVDTIAPELPPDVFKAVDDICKWFDDVGGFENVMKGQGESGVRAGVHAESLMRSAGTRLRDRALLVERQLGNAGDFAFKLLQNKEAKIFMTKPQNLLQKFMVKTQPGEEFLLKQLPDDYRVQVDSHSASPAFSEDARQLALQLAKMGVIDAVSVLEMVHPPQADLLIQRAEEKQAAEARFAQEHPELLTKGKKKK